MSFYLYFQCTATCGQGVKVRDVTCVNKLNRNSFTVAEESNCLKEEKPATEELCETLPDCPPEWYTSQWTEVRIFKPIFFLLKVIINVIFLLLYFSIAKFYIQMLCISNGLLLSPDF